MQAWQKAWREGIVQQLPTDGLHALREGLQNDDGFLIQGKATEPALSPYADGACHGCDPIAYCFFKTDSDSNLRSVERAWARVVGEAAKALGDEFAVRCFHSFWDDSPREEAIEKLLAEVELELDIRKPFPLHRRPRPVPA